MNINCRKFRLSTYKEHKVMGLPPMRELRFTQYQSGDNGGRQQNYAMKVGLTTWHLKWRSNAAVEPPA